MPRRKSPLSLENLCLNVVTIRFEEIKTQDQVANLPSLLRNNIFQKLCHHLEQENERRLPSNIFIHPGAMSLHHLYLFNLPTTLLYDKIAQVCKNIVHLNLEEYEDAPKVATESTVKLLQRLPKLQHLNLSYRDECTDEVAAAIGENCPHLTYLNIKWCTKVTDIGLRSLSRCNKLVYLNVIATTNATVEGCFFLLNHLPVLKVLKYTMWSELLNKLENQLKRNKTLRTYAIEEVSETFNKHIPLLRTFFPNLKDLSFFSVENHLDFDFLLWAQRLTSLHLYDVQPVNIRLIDRAWPMLEILSLTDCSISNESDGVITAPLKNLRQLVIDDDSLVTRREIKTLIVQCRSLEKLSFAYCEMNVTDDLISELIESNALQNLKMLTFKFCLLITSTSIMKLLDVQNPMNKLFFWECRNIDDSGYEEIKNYVKSKNLDLRVEEMAW